MKYQLYVETFTGLVSTDAGVHAEREYPNDMVAKKEMEKMAKELLVTSTRVNYKIIAGKRLVHENTATQRNRPGVLAWDELV